MSMQNVFDFLSHIGEQIKDLSDPVEYLKRKMGYMLLEKNGIPLEEFHDRSQTSVEVLFHRYSDGTIEAALYKKIDSIYVKMPEGK